MLGIFMPFGMASRDRQQVHGFYLGQAGTTVDAALQLALQLHQALVFIPLDQLGSDGIFGDVEAGTELLAARLHRHRQFGAGHQQHAAMCLGRQFVLE